MNMKTSTFEVMKQHLLNLLEKHEVIQKVKLVRTSKATTAHEKEADMEYHIDVDLVIHENVHHLKLKCFNSNCRIQVQHIGKGPHQPQSHLKGRSPPKFFTEEILFPIAKSINDDINLEKEKEFVIHLKKEITRLKKISKAMPKTKTNNLAQAMLGSALAWLRLS